MGKGTWIHSGSTWGLTTCPEAFSPGIWKSGFEGLRQRPAWQESRGKAKQKAFGFNSRHTRYSTVYLLNEWMNFLSSFLWYFMVLGLTEVRLHSRTLALSLFFDVAGSWGQSRGNRTSFLWGRERERESELSETNQTALSVNFHITRKEENRVTWGWKGLGGYFAIFLPALKKWRGCSFIHWKNFN